MNQPQANIRVQTMFEAWQVGANYMRFRRDARGTGLRFGQWFMKDHNLTGHSKLFYETDDNKAKEYILRMTL